jgi:hypothetical protein
MSRESECVQPKLLKTPHVGVRCDRSNIDLCYGFRSMYLHMGTYLAARLGQKKKLQASLVLVRNNSLLAPYSTASTMELGFIMIKTLAKTLD